MSDTQPTPTFDPDGTALRRSEGLGEQDRLGGYVIRRLLGEGGMGRVYAADDPALGRAVALKVMRPEAAQRADAKERFLREARAAAAVTHDHIVRIYQVGEDGGVPFIAMELLAGQPLDSLAGKPVPMTDVIRIGTEVASALAVAHAVGLVHRDIKPANLWVEEPSGRVKVLDFGLARLAREVTITNTGQIFGTPAYMAPEQAAAATLDGRADVFSLGCVLYHLATGRRPFDGPDVFAVLHQIANLTPPPPHHLNPNVPQVLSDLIIRMMAKTAADRPTAEDVVGELRGRSANLATRPPATGHPSPSNHLARKQGLISLLIDAKNIHDHLSPTAFSVPFFLVALGAVLGGMALGLIAGYCVFQLLTLILGVTEQRLGYATYILGPGGLVAGLIGGLISYLVWYRWLWQRRLGRTTDRLLRDYPAEAVQWGGKLALRDRAVVDSLLAKVVAEDFTVHPTPTEVSVALPGSITVGANGEAGADGVGPRTDPAARKQALIALLHETKKAHARLSLTPVAVLHFLIAVGLGFCGFSFGVLWSNPTPLATGLCVGGVAGIGYLVWHYWRWCERRTQAIDRLLREYPVEASRWVGSVTLRDRAVVEALYTAVQADDFAVSPAAIRPVTRDGAGSKLRLVTILLDAKAAHKRLSLFYIPPLGEIALGLFVVLLGIPIGCVAFAVAYRAGDYSSGTVTFMVSGFVWVAGTLLTMFLLSHRKARRQLRHSGDQLLSDFRTEATEWGGELALQDRAVVDSLLIRLIVSGF